MPRQKRTTPTPRETQVLEAIGEGLTMKEIALRLGITPRTVRDHSDRLRDLFGVDFKRELIPIAQSYRTNPDQLTLEEAA